MPWPPWTDRRPPLGGFFMPLGFLGKEKAANSLSLSHQRYAHELRIQSHPGQIAQTPQAVHKTTELWGLYGHRSSRMALCDAKKCGLSQPSGPWFLSKRLEKDRHIRGQYSQYVRDEPDFKGDRMGGRGRGWFHSPFGLHGISGL